MRKFLIVLLLLLFLAAALFGIEAASAGTHKIMGDPNYQTFLGW